MGVMEKTVLGCFTSLRLRTNSPRFISSSLISLHTRFCIYYNVKDRTFICKICMTQKVFNINYKLQLKSDTNIVLFNFIMYSKENIFNFYHVNIKPNGKI